MKKNILIFCTALATFSLLAFGYVNWSNAAIDQEEVSISKFVVFNNDFIIPFKKQADPDLIYKVEPRFLTTITKEKLSKAKSIIDILPKEATKSIESYQEVEVSILDNDNDNNIELSEPGKGDLLNPAQIKLLQTADYSTNIYIKADFKRRNAVMADLMDSYLTYFISVIPEKEAEFISGMDALIAYVKENSKEETAILQQNKLQPGKISFTITKKGIVANVKLISTSGYLAYDKKLLDLVTRMPGTWKSATNSKGEKVDQELVFFFGTMGC